MRTENPFQSTGPFLAGKEPSVNLSRWSALPALTDSGSSGSLSSMVSLSRQLQQRDQANSGSESSENESDGDRTMGGSGSSFNFRNLPKEKGSDEQVRQHCITFEQIDAHLHSLKTLCIVYFTKRAQSCETIMMRFLTPETGSELLLRIQPLVLQRRALKQEAAVNPLAFRRQKKRRAGTYKRSAAVLDVFQPASDLPVVA